ncbi:hypothetical protein SAFG77S_11866 [Streptomyces afghaniensis]
MPALIMDPHRPASSASPSRATTTSARSCRRSRTRPQCGGGPARADHCPGPEAGGATVIRRCPCAPRASAPGTAHAGRRPGALPCVTPGYARPACGKFEFPFTVGPMPSLPHRPSPDSSSGVASSAAMPKAPQKGFDLLRRSLEQRKRSRAIDRLLELPKEPRPAAAGTEAAPAEAGLARPVGGSI